jgi:hypothetical protein
MAITLSARLTRVHRRRDRDLALVLVLLTASVDDGAGVDDTAVTTVTGAGRGQSVAVTRAWAAAEGELMADPGNATYTTDRTGWPSPCEIRDAADVAPLALEWAALSPPRHLSPLTVVPRDGGLSPSRASTAELP